MIIDVQFNQANNSWPVLLEATQAAESAGFGATWVYDHLAGRSLGGSTMLEAFTLLGALAATTTTIELGLLVANVANRQPAALGIGAASVDAIAGRRFWLGIGAGSSPTSPWAAEMHAIGQVIEPSVELRHARVVQTLDVLDALWSPDRPDDLATFPRPVRRPPVIVGLTSIRLAELAGLRADGINVRWADPRRDQLFDAAVSAAQGRTGDFSLTVWMRWDDALLDPEHPERRAMAARGVDRLVLADLDTLDPAHIETLRPR